MIDQYIVQIVTKTVRSKSWLKIIKKKKKQCETKKMLTSIKKEQLASLAEEIIKIN